MWFDVSRAQAELESANGPHPPAKVANPANGQAEPPSSLAGLAGLAGATLGIPKSAQAELESADCPQPPATFATTAIRHSETHATPRASAKLPPVNAPVSWRSEAQAPVAEIEAPNVLTFTPPPIAPVPLRQGDDPFRHGRSAGGNPRTWTGRIVSLTEWRGLSAWNRHGPDGRLFCGICRDWVLRGGCTHCEGGAA
jgi:hypothetical protein